MSAPNACALGPIKNDDGRGVTCGVGPANSSRCFVMRCQGGTKAFSVNLPSSNLLICHVGPGIANKGLGCGKAAHLSRRCLFHPKKAAGLSNSVDGTTFDTRDKHASLNKATSFGPFCDSKGRTGFTLTGVSSYNRAVSFSLLRLVPRVCVPGPSMALNNTTRDAIRIGIRTSIT